MINDPCLTFPVLDCDEELDIYSESNTSGIANSWANGDEDDNLSDLLSASQIGTIGTMVGESDLQLFSEASCAHSVRLSMATSHLSNYFSKEDGNKSSESLIFRWFKFTLKPPYSIAHDNLRLAIWDTSFWTFWLKFGHKGP